MGYADEYLALLHRSLVASQGLLFHGHHLWQTVAVDGELQIHRDGAVDPFAAARILDVVVMLEAGGVITIWRFLAQPDVTADRCATAWPARVIGLDVLPDRIDRFPAFIKKIDVGGVE